ncbi:MAG: hypothetical protein KKH91_03490 [Elusimicrobia bacterium]|nr:hypothetical protein [Elusimicrobiota bacterium]MBU2615280.1 hypothetical protein [Elusimicrobiota bacterium]
MNIDAKGIHYRELNEKIHQLVDSGEKDIVLDNINGQRYIGDGLRGPDVKITINGVPGNDLAAFMDGPTIIVNANAQDGVANTMNSGKVIIRGNAGDIVGHSMRGGKIFIQEDVGYRVGIHMKAYKELYPIIIVGGTAQDFFGEYMSGGLMVVLGLNKKPDQPIVGNYVGTGMHAGIMYIRGKVEDYQLGKEIKKFAMDEEDKARLKVYLEEYNKYFDIDLESILKDEFVKLIPYVHRPYGKLYTY